MKKLKRQNSLFLQWDVSSVLLKTGKLGKLKRELLKIFKYYTFFMGWSYWLPKSGQNSRKK